MTWRSSKSLRLVAGLALALWLGLAPVISLASGDGPVSPTGNYYIVQPGDSWGKIAARNGTTASQLIAANPSLLRPRYVLWPGDRMYIPLGKVPTAANGTGYWYTVKRGDSWQTVSRDTGVSVLDLWHANPGQLRPNRWLYTGTRLWIPGAAGPGAAAPAAPTPTAAPPASGGAVSPSASSTATETAVPPTPAPAVPTIVTTAPASVNTPAPLTASTPVTATVAPIQLTPSVVVTATAAAPSAAASTTAVPGGCFTSLSDYDAAIAAQLNAPSATADGLQSWLTKCGAIKPGAGSVTVAGIRSPVAHDVIVAISDPSQDQPDAPGRLVVYHALANGYVLAGAAAGQGKVTVLRVGDLNADGLTDIVWTDTVCGASICYSTLFVDSWTGNNYQSWLQEQPITANARYDFQPLAGASGLAIVITGTLSSSVAAPGLQATPAAPAATSAPAGTQTFTETWISQNGGLYHRAATPPATAGTPTSAPTAANTTVPTATGVPEPVATPAASGPQSPIATPSAPTPAAVSTASVIHLPTLGLTTGTAQPPATAVAGQTPAAATDTQAQSTATGPCLAARVQDANVIFNAWNSDGFGPAIQTYQKVLSDTPNTCGLSADQVGQLLDFVRFRLMVATIGNGAADQAPAYRNQISTAAVKGISDAFMSSYSDTHSLVQACRDTTTYTQAHPESWQFLAQGNTESFAADDVCPLAK